MNDRDEIFGSKEEIHWSEDNPRPIKRVIAAAILGAGIGIACWAWPVEIARYPAEAVPIGVGLRAITSVVTASVAFAVALLVWL